MAQQISTNTFTVAKWVVSPDPTQGTHTTIQAAITSSSSGDSIFIRSGTYTENLTLKAGITLTGMQGAERTPTVTIIGNATFSAAGTVSLGNLRLQTNASFCLSVTGSAASILKITSCEINATNNTAISFTSSNAAAQIRIARSSIDIGTTGIAFYASTSPGTISMRYTNTTNSGGTSTACTSSAGLSEILYCNILFPLSCTGTGNFSMFYSSMDTSAQNASCISVLGTSTSTTLYNTFSSGTATAVTVGGNATFQLIRSTITSSNVNAITQTGSGVLKTGFITFTGTSAGISGTLTTLAGHWLTGDTINVSADANASTINLGTGAAAKIITIGSTNTTSALTLNTGTGNYILNGVAGTTYTMGASTTTGTMTIGGTAQTGTMTLGSSSGTNIVALGAGTGATTVNIAGGATNAKAVNIATGAVANVTTIGTTTASSTLTLNAPALGLIIGGKTEGALVTSSTGQVSTVTGTTGFVLTANAAGTAPSFQAASAGGTTWSVITINQTAAVNNGYICNKAGTLALALPASAAVGAVIEVLGINTATGWQITQAAGQQIFFGTTQTTSGATGTLTSSAIRDAIKIVCITANTTWQVVSVIGNITVV